MKTAVQIKPLMRAEDHRYNYFITRVINPKGECYTLDMRTLDGKLRLFGSFFTEQGARACVRKAKELFKKGLADD